MDISAAAAQSVPDEMEEWRLNAEWLSIHSIDPDLWKSSDAEEGPRHFVEVEQLDMDVSALPNSIDAYYDQVGVCPAEKTGLAAWTIFDLQQRLTQAMAVSNWIEAVQVGAALGHYVADIHQPLHCTVNYDGQYTWQGGLHERWEMIMPESRWSSTRIKHLEVVYLDDPWQAVLSWIAHSHALVSDILKADIVAKNTADHSVTSSDYYKMLWKQSGQIFVMQANAAASHLSSLWYTAWVNAGKPDIIGGVNPGKERGSIHLQSAEDHGMPWVFFSLLGVIGIVIIAMSVRSGKKAKA